MGTLGYYIIIGILRLFSYEDTFLKKSLETKLDWFSSLHDALTSIWLIITIFTYGIGWYYTFGILLFTYLMITLYEYFKESIFFFRNSHKEMYYSKYMTVDWEEVERIVKLEKDEEQARTED